MNQELEIPPTRVLQLEMNPPQWLAAYFYPDGSQLIQIYTPEKQNCYRYNTNQYLSVNNRLPWSELVDYVLCKLVALAAAILYPIMHRVSLFEREFVWVTCYAGSTCACLG